MTRAHEDPLTMARKPPLPMGDDVALPGVGTPKPQARPPTPPEALPAAGDGSRGGAGARPSTSPPRRWSTSIRPESTSFGSRRSGPQSEGVRLIARGPGGVG